MDAAATLSRVDAIQTMISQLVAPPVTPAKPATDATTSTTSATTPASFAATLASATAPTATTATAASVTPGGGPVSSTLDPSTPYAAQITSAAQRNGIDPALLAGLIKQESGFDPNAASGAGAVGLTQLMPGTAASLGVTDSTDPEQAIDGGARYLAQQLKTFGNDPSKALAAYNAGPGAVQKFNGIPPYAETQNYVKSVLAFADQYRGVPTT